MNAQKDVDEESLELARFREAWREEVRQRKSTRQPNGPPPQNETSTFTASGSGSSNANQPAVWLPSHPIPSGLASACASTAPDYTFKGDTQLGHPLARAVEIYRSAARHEQEGLLDDALRLYRQAFRLEPNVDRAYFSETQRLQRLATTQPVTASRSHQKTASFEKREANFSTTRAESHPTSGVLASLIADFPSNLTFASDNKHGGATLSLIPDELLLRILRSLDTTTIERFATVCRKARVLSLDSLIWRDFVYLAYKPPQILNADSISAIVNSYAANYRQIYIEHPRLRLDGLYIAVCHYTRRGASEYAWVDNIHLITYHRYLRFFADGTVLSLLANEDISPQNIIPMLKPSLRMKGFHVGRWQLDGSAVQISNLHSPHESSPSRYHFQMALTLHSKPLGRWNKLEIFSYESVDAEGEAVPLALKHERPFWFSKVKSYPGYH